MFIVLVMPSSHLMLWSPLLLLSLVFLSIRDFSNESSVHIRWPKSWSYGFSISPSSKYSEFISLNINWFEIFAVQGTFRTLLQHHSSKASILGRSAFFMVQLSQLYLTTGKTIVFTMWAFASRLWSYMILGKCLNFWGLPFFKIRGTRMD